MLAFYSDDPSSSPAEVDYVFCKMLFEKANIEQKAD